MPGSSLWLLPPKGHALDALLSSLMQKTACYFGSPHSFLPHVTLTSEIEASTYDPNPQQWLDRLEFPSGKDVIVKFSSLRSEDVFVRKLYIQVQKPGVQELGKIARKAVKGFEDDGAAGEWAERKYNPHLSLLYHDCPQVADHKIADIEKMVQDARVTLNGEGELSGWAGGRVVLIPTDRPIKDWSPIAARNL